jgi:hypothetical protein
MIRLHVINTFSRPSPILFKMTKVDADFHHELYMIIHCREIQGKIMIQVVKDALSYRAIFPNQFNDPLMGYFAYTSQMADTMIVIIKTHKRTTYIHTNHFQ